MKIQLLIPLFFISLLLVNCSPKSSVVITQAEYPIIVPQAPMAAISHIHTPAYHLELPSFLFEKAPFVLGNLTQSSENFSLDLHPDYQSTNCPVCHKNDQLIPIVYGRPGLHLQHQSQKGEVVLGGCVVSSNSPKFLCKRDEARF